MSDLKEKIAAYLQANPTAKVHEPATKTAVVRIIAIEPMEVNGKSFNALTAITATGDEFSATLSNNMLEWNKSKLTVDGVAKIEYEVRIAEKTGYLNEAGELKFHTSSGNDVRKVAASSVTMFDREAAKFVAEQDEEAFLSKLDSHGIEGMNAVANYRSATYQYRK